MNAKEELLDIIENKNITIKCAHLYTEYLFKNEPIFILKCNYTLDEYNNFLKELDFEYDNGYGMQHLYGIVWLSDNTWLSRSEYDGSEYWVHNILPEIPKELI